MTVRFTAVKEGNIDVFGSLFRSHYARLLAYCRLFVRDEMAAEDLVQDTFIHFWEKRSSLDPERSMESLLFVSLRNRCLNYLRDKNLDAGKLNDYKASTMSLQSVSHYDYLEQEGLSVEDELLEELNAAIELLPQRCREVVRLAKLEGFKNQEVAEKLGISVKAVEKHLAVGKQKIAAYMKANPSFSLLFLLF